MFNHKNINKKVVLSERGINIGSRQLIWEEIAGTREFSNEVLKKIHYKFPFIELLLVNGKIINAKLSKLDRNFLFMVPACKDLTICMRIVYSDFEAVRLAYGDEVQAKIPFIQLYVLGDDFALDDEYYRGGVTW